MNIVSVLVLFNLFFMLNQQQNQLFILKRLLQRIIKDCLALKSFLFEMKRKEKKRKDLSRCCCCWIPRRDRCCFSINWKFFFSLEEWHSEETKSSECRSMTRNLSVWSWMDLVCSSLRIGHAFASVSGNDRHSKDSTSVLSSTEWVLFRWERRETKDEREMNLAKYTSTYLKNSYRARHLPSASVLSVLQSFCPNSVSSNEQGFNVFPNGSCENERLSWSSLRSLCCWFRSTNILLTVDRISRTNPFFTQNLSMFDIDSLPEIYETMIDRPALIYDSLSNAASSFVSHNLTIFCSFFIEQWNWTREPCTDLSNHSIINLNQVCSFDSSPSLEQGGVLPSRFDIFPFRSMMINERNAIWTMTIHRIWLICLFVFFKNRRV